MGNKEYDKWHLEKGEYNDDTTIWHQFSKESLEKNDLISTKILEIGCGRGGFSAFLANESDESTEIYACDYSEKALEIAKERFKIGYEKINWKVEDIQNISFQSNQFDVVISCETIEHVPNPIKALGELHRVLKPGGKLILTCPNYFNLFGIWCLYRWIIGKPFTEGGQPYVNYILIPRIFMRLKSLKFKVNHFHSAELIIPARVPKTFYRTKLPKFLSFMGYRTFYVLTKK